MNGIMSPAKKRKKSANRKSPPARGKRTGVEKQRLWLVFPPKLIQRPVIWELGHKFEVVTNIRQVSITDEIGLTCLELEGLRAEIDRGIVWLERLGIQVKPVEIDVIGS